MTYNTWDTVGADHDPADMPADWGMEIDIAQYNPALSGTRPFCAAGYLEEFWAAQIGPNEGIHSWAVYDNIGSDISSPIGAYYDSNADLDECSRQSMAIGVAYPGNIGSQFGVATLQTLIRTTLADTSGTQFSAFAQAVSNDCNDLALPPQSDCMGINIWRSFPGPGSQVLPIVGAQRGWSVPNCTYTTQPDYVVQWEAGIGWGCIQF